MRNTEVAVRKTEAAVKTQSGSERRVVAAAIAVSVLTHGILFIGLSILTAAGRVPVGQGRIVFQAGRGTTAAGGAIAAPAAAPAVPARVPKPALTEPSDASARADVTGDDGQSAAGAGNGETGAGTGGERGAPGAAAGYLAARERFIALLAARKAYPRLARDKGIEGAVGVSVRLDSGGAAEGVAVRRSSGSGLLDAAALNLVRRCLPFPHGLGTELALEITIAYRLKD